MILFIFVAVAGIALCAYSRLNKDLQAYENRNKAYHLFGASLSMIAFASMGGIFHLCFTKLHLDFVLLRAVSVGLVFACYVIIMLIVMGKLHKRSMEKRVSLYDLRGIVVKTDKKGRVTKVRLYREDDSIVVKAQSGDVFKVRDHIVVDFPIDGNHVHISHIESPATTRISF